MKRYDRLIFISVLLALGFFARAADSPSWVHLSSHKGDLPPANGGPEQTGCAVADVNRDGSDDFVITERTQGPSVVLFLRNIVGWNRYPLEPAPLRIEAGGAFFDIDGDADLDYAVGADARDNQVWWWENPHPRYDPNIPWRRRLIKNSGANKHHDLTFGDFKGTGKSQLVFWNQGARKLFLADIPDDPRNTEPWPFVEIYSWEGAEHEGIARTDIDGDGLVDIIGGGRWFKYRGGTSFTPVVIDDGQRFTRAAAGQLKKGGRPEVVFVAGDLNGRLKWYEATGSPTKSESWVGNDLLGLDVVRGHGLQVADINGDGNLDILNGEQAKWTRGKPDPDNADARARIFYGDGKGNFQLKELVSGLCFHEAKLGDLDGDGDLDILNKPYALGTPRVDVWLNNGTKKKPLGRGVLKRRMKGSL